MPDSSYRVPALLGASNHSDIIQYSNVIRNFLNYVLLHRVCPEYAADVEAARKICDKAEFELWEIAQFNRLIPGDFSKATSTLYGGYYAELWLNDQAWATTEEKNADITKEQALTVFKAAIGIMASEEVYHRVIDPQNKIQITATKMQGLEIIKITPPSEEGKKGFASIRDYRGALGHVKPLGTIIVKPWANSEADEEDLTAVEEETKLCGLRTGTSTQELWIEDELLEHCFVGMKIEAVVKELNIGLRFLDHIHGVYCSFHTYLENERMKDWKEPVLSERAGPTIDDPDADDEAGADDFD